jgi:glycosyltransferase involved in cell wall biosynthesis
MRTNISVVIPSYKVSKYILDVIKDIPEFVNHIIIVDDKCPQNSGQIAKTSTDNRVIICYHEKNLGVGGGSCNWI